MRIEQLLVDVPPARRAAGRRARRGCRRRWGCGRHTGPRTTTCQSSQRVTVTSSCSDTAWKTVARSWKPSARRGPTRSSRLTFAGARTVTAPCGVAARSSPHPTARGSPPCGLPSRRGDARERDDVELLAAGARVDAGGPQQGLRGRRPSSPSRERGAQRLAALREGGVDAAEHLLAGRRRDAAGRGGPARRVRSRRSAPARRRCGRTLPASRRRAYQAALRLGHAVGSRARPGGEPLGHLQLHHDQHPLEATASAGGRSARPGTEML